MSIFKCTVKLEKTIWYKVINKYKLVEKIKPNTYKMLLDIGRILNEEMMN